MKKLKIIGIILFWGTFFIALIHLYFVHEFVEVYTLYSFLMFIGSVFQFFPQYRYIRDANDVNLQDRKYFFGIVCSMAFFLVLTVYAVYEFYLI